MTNKKKHFLGSIKDAVSNIFYYDRKNDEELSSADIDELIESGEVTLDEIVNIFKDEILENYEF